MTSNCEQIARTDVSLKYNESERYEKKESSKFILV